MWGQNQGNRFPQGYPMQPQQPMAGGYPLGPPGSMPLPTGPMPYGPAGNYPSNPYYGNPYPQGYPMQPQQPMAGGYPIGVSGAMPLPSGPLPYGPAGNYPGGYPGNFQGGQGLWGNEHGHHHHHHGIRFRHRHRHGHNHWRCHKKGNRCHGSSSSSCSSDSD